MPRRKCEVFNFFKTKKRNGKDIYSCKFCSVEYTRHATRMTKHLINCILCPGDIKKGLISDKEAFTGNMMEIPSTSNDESGLSSREASMTSSMSARSASRSGEQARGKLKMFFDSISDAEKENLDTSLARAIYSSGTPLSITEDKEWCNFFKQIRPSYKPPSRHIISNKLLVKEYELAQQKTKETIAEAKTIGIQCDGWSNIRNEAILNVVVTTPQPVLYKTFCTEAEKHTAEYIAKEILDTIAEIGGNKVLGLVTDNAAAMVKARKIISEKTGIITYGCIAHALNLLIGDIMKTSSLKNLEGHCKQIIKEITGSHILLSTFNKFQVEKTNEKIALKLPVITRWGSILKCMESLWKTRHALKMLAICEDVSDKISISVKRNCLDDEVFWVKIEKSMNILSPIVKWITKLEGDDMRLSDVMEAFYDLEEIFKSEVANLPVSKKEEEAIHNYLRERKRKIVIGVHYAANILNPNKQGKHLDREEHSEGIDYINSMAASNEHFREKENDLIIELAQYIGRTEMFGKSYLWKNVEKIDSLTWWQGYCAKSVLKDLAVAILSLPPSSAATERSFSKYSFIHTKRRNRLTVKRAGMLTYVACNLKLTSKSEPVSVKYSFNQQQIEERENEDILLSKTVESENANIDIEETERRQKSRGIRSTFEVDSEDSEYSDSNTSNEDVYSVHDTESSVGEENFDLEPPEDEDPTKE